MANQKTDYTIRVGADTTGFKQSLAEALATLNKADQSKIQLDIDDAVLVKQIRTAMTEINKELEKNGSVDASKILDVQDLAAKLRGVEDIITSLRDSVALLGLSFTNMAENANKIINTENNFKSVTEEAKKTKKSVQEVADAEKALIDQMSKGASTDGADKHTKALKKQADQAIKTDEAIRKLFTDENGKPTTANISGDEYTDIKAEGAAFGKSDSEVIDALKEKYKELNTISSDSSSRRAADEQIVSNALLEEKNRIAEIDAAQKQFAADSGITPVPQKTSVEQDQADYAGIASKDTVSIINQETTAINELDAAQREFAQNVDETAIDKAYSESKKKIDEATAAQKKLNEEIKKEPEPTVVATSTGTVNAADYASAEEKLNSISEQVKNMLNNSFSEIRETSIKQLSDGMVKFSAYVKDSDGEWKKFTTNVNKDLSLVNTQFDNVTAKKEKTLNAVSDYTNDVSQKEGTKSASISEPIYNADEVKKYAEEVTAAIGSVLDQGKRYRVEVDAMGKVSIAETMVKDGKSVDKFKAKFEDVVELLDSSKNNFDEFKKYFDTAFKTNSYSISVGGSDVSEKNISKQSDSIERLGYQYERASSDVKNFVSQTGKIFSYGEGIDLVNQKMAEWNKLEEKRANGTATKKEIDDIRVLQKELNSVIKQYSSANYDINNSQGRAVEVDVQSDDYMNVEQKLREIAMLEEDGEVVASRYNESQQRLSAVFKTVDGAMKTVTYSYNELTGVARKNTTAVEGQVTGFGKLKNSLTEMVGVFTAGMTGYNIAFALFNQIQHGFDVLLQYDDALTNISYTMDLTSDALKNMGQSAVDMADDMSISIENAMDIYKIYANMNTSQAEINQTAIPTAILANLESGTTETASDQIQGIMQQFDMVSSEATHVVDVLDTISANVAIDNAKAINVVTESIKASGQAAYDAGLSYEQLAAISAKMAESTREDGSSIGNALKTIITRLSKAGTLSGADSVDNETLSEASKSLSEVGIQVYNVDGSFRELDTIIGELQGKWDSLTDAQKSNISFSINKSSRVA